MREIKFRGKRLDTGEWVYGSLIQMNKACRIMSHNLAAHPGWQSFEVDPATVGQFIGLKDKNGVEIYEGDVVALDMWHGNEHGYIPEDGVVKWYQPSSAFKWFSLEEDPSDGNNYWLSQADEHQREVIGNIYENPELLEPSNVS